MKDTGSEIEIYFLDLSKEAQEELLDAMGMKTSNEGNYDIFPIAVIPKPKIDDGKIMKDMLNRELTEEEIKAIREWALPPKVREIKLKPEVK